MMRVELPEGDLATIIAALEALATRYKSPQYREVADRVRQQVSLSIITEDLYITTQRLTTPGDADCWIEGVVISERLEAAGHYAEAMSFPMYLCPTCGNKRCPKATWHENECTHSNDPEQPGSHYGGLTPDQTEALKIKIIKETA